eukprot:249920_1
MPTKHANKGQNSNQNKVVIIICVTLIATIAGMTMVLEFGVNISLSNWMKHPLRSAWINFTIGAVVLLPLFIICNQNTSDESDRNTTRDIFNNLISAFKNDKKNYGVLLNGLCGVIAVISPIYIAPSIGFALYTISVIFGQIIASMLMDNYGLFWSEIKRLSIINFIGAFAAICGIIIFQIPSFNQNNNDEEEINIGLIILYMIIAIFAGISVTIQSALNRRLKDIINGTPYQSAFLSFLNASIILTIINIIIYIVLNDWFETNTEFLKWYMFFGGLIGAFVVSMMIICPSYIGFVATYICVIFGSLIMSIIFDYFDAFGISTNEQVHKSVFRIFGVIIVFIGAILVNIPSKNQYKLTNNEDNDDMDQYQMKSVKSNSEIDTDIIQE